MKRIPEMAMDYPHELPRHRWIWWHGSAEVWPSARRALSYLSDKQCHVLGGFALFTPFAENATTFATETEARQWLAIHEAKRGAPYSVCVSTVADMIAMRFSEETAP